MMTPKRRSPKTILLVEDSDDCRIVTKWVLSAFGYKVATARNGLEALERFNPKVHQVVITDNSMPGMTGLELARKIKHTSPATPVVMYTGSPPADQSGLDLVIQRPTHLVVLIEALEKVLAQNSR